jgi:hypothetical protein
LWRGGGPGDEPLRVLAVGGGQDAGAAGPDGCGCAVVDVSGGVQAQARVPVLDVVPGKKAWQYARAASIEPKRAGNPGRYLRVLNCASD